MEFKQVIDDWKSREIKFKYNEILEMGFKSWEDYRFSFSENKPGILVRNQIIQLLDPGKKFDCLDYDFNFLMKSTLAPCEKWNLSHSRGLSSTSLSSAYLRVYQNNLWSNAYDFAISRMIANQNVSLVGVYSRQLDKVLIIDGCHTLIAYLRMLAVGIQPRNCKIFIQTVDFSLENLFFNIFNS